MSSASGLAVRLIFGLKQRDLDSTTLYRRELIQEIGPIVQPTETFIPVEIAWRAAKAGKRIREIEIDHFPRTVGTP